MRDLLQELRVHGYFLLEVLQLLQEIHVNNYDCGNIEFDDMLNHGYKQVYGKIVETFNL